MCGPHHCLGRGASAPDSAIVRTLLQQHQDAPVIGQRCTSLSSNSANRKHQITRHPWRTSPPLRPSLSFRYTHGFSGTTNLSATPRRPACPSRASSWSSLRPRRGASRVAYAFLVYMLSPLPRRSVWAYFFAHFTQPYQPSPKGSSGRPAHCPFRGLLGVHSRYGLHTRAVTNS